MSWTPFDSPALFWQAEEYPPEWCGRVPKRVVVVRTIRYGSWTIGQKQPIAIVGTIFDVFVASSGHMVLLFETGEGMNLDRPGTMIRVVEWHKRSLMSETVL